MTNLKSRLKFAIVLYNKEIGFTPTLRESRRVEYITTAEIAFDLHTIFNSDGAGDGANYLAAILPKIGVDTPSQNAAGFPRLSLELNIDTSVFMNWGKKTIFVD